MCLLITQPLIFTDLPLCFRSYSTPYGRTNEKLPVVMGASLQWISGPPSLHDFTQCQRYQDSSIRYRRKIPCGSIRSTCQSDSYDSKLEIVSVGHTSPGMALCDPDSDPISNPISNANSNLDFFIGHSASSWTTWVSKR